MITLPIALGAIVSSLGEFWFAHGWILFLTPFVASLVVGIVHGVLEDREERARDKRRHSTVRQNRDSPPKTKRQKEPRPAQAGRDAAAKVTPAKEAADASRARRNTGPTKGARQRQGTTRAHRPGTRRSRSNANCETRGAASFRPVGKPKEPAVDWLTGKRLHP